YQGKYEEAVLNFDRVPRVFQPPLRSYQMAWSLMAQGKNDEAAKELTQGIAETPADTGGVLHAARAMRYAKSGDRKRAKTDAGEAIRLWKGYGHFHHTA